MWPGSFPLCAFSVTQDSWIETICQRAFSQGKASEDATFQSQSAAVVLPKACGSRGSGNLLQQKWIKSEVNWNVLKARDWGGPGSFRMGGQNMNSSDFVIFHCCFHTFITAENHFLSIPNSNRAKESAGTLSVGQTTLNHSGEQKFVTVLSHQPWTFSAEMIKAKLSPFSPPHLFFIYIVSMLRRGILRQPNLE